MPSKVGTDTRSLMVVSTLPPDPRPRRVSAEVPVRFGAALKNSREAGAIVNVSVGGLFVHAATLFPVNTPLWVAFALPLDAGSRPLAAAASVRWINHPAAPPAPALPPGMGLAFRDLDGPARAVLDAFVAERLAAADSLRAEGADPRS